MSIDIMKWLRSQEGTVLVPLFDVDETGRVKTRLCGKRKILMRHPKMEQTVIDLIEKNINNEKWEGLLYVMVAHKKEGLVPLYVGKTEKKGVKHPISANIKNISKNKGKFARWGNGIDYHIGDLSHALFQFDGDKKPKPKFQTWAETLFKSFTPPVLKQPIELFLVPWYEEQKGPSKFEEPLPTVEKQVIRFADEQFPEYLLNVDGR